MDCVALVKAFEAIDGYDKEMVHGEAEALLLAWLTEVGYAEVAEAYAAVRDRVGFWYA